MFSVQQHSRLAAVATALWLACSGSALAGQPLGKMAAQMMHQAQSRVAAPAVMRLPESRLDLRPPTAGPLAESHAVSAFPSSIHHDLGFSVGNKSLPTLGSGSPAPRIMSKPEELAKNFRREGLPLAKLWQNQDSLVHIGLNPKGKPGLWLIQKLH